MSHLSARRLVRVVIRKSSDKRTPHVWSDTSTLVPEDGSDRVQEQGSRVTRLAAILAGLTVSLFAASPAEAAPTEFFGIAQGRELDAQDLNGMKASHVRTDRFMINWKGVQPSQGPINWSATDRVVGGLAWHGIRPVPFVWGSPQWVRPGPSRPPVGTAFAETAWQNFLKAAVARYKPGGSYWANGYRQRYGAGATPLPIQSWQIWNEPNLQKYFDPGGTSGQGIQKYARLVKISHAAIKSKDPQARIVLAGLLGSGRPLAWDFLSGLYKVSGFKNNFDVAALHPYHCCLDGFRRQILRFRAPMMNHGDGATPLWLTELAWGSAPPDDFGINKGLAGQAQMLRDSFNIVLSHRGAWNVKRLFWFLWRDPPPSQGTGGCSFCASAGLLRYDRNPEPPYDNPKPAYNWFRFFTTTPPQASITAGPAQAGFTKDPTPSFSFTSNKAGSTFTCRIDAGPFTPCSSPRTLPLLSNGSHIFYVTAIDAAGNESRIVWRYFTVDTQAPPAPQITDTDPNSPANDNAPEVKGSTAGGTTVRLFKTAGCTAGTAVAVGSAAKFASPGITATVPDNTTTPFRATATDAAGNVSPCSGAFTYVEASTP
jgi:Glycosyl hydrolase catalytic core